MNELLDKILGSTLLTEDNKQELKDAWTNALNEAKEQASVEVKASLAEQYVEDKQKLIEALDTKAQEILTKELTEFTEELANYKDLEVEMQTKLIEARHEMAEVVAGDFSKLVESLSDFLDKRLEQGFEELKEDIDEARKAQFGAKVFESIAREYGARFHNENSVSVELEKNKTELTEAVKELTEAKTELKKIKHTAELNKVLEPLTGGKRELMENLIRTYPTNKLQEAYTKYIPKVLHTSVEKVEETTEKENDNSSVLAESNTSTKSEEQPSFTVKDGNTPLNESTVIPPKGNLSQAMKDKLRKMAGVK